MGAIVLWRLCCVLFDSVFLWFFLWLVAVVEVMVGGGVSVANAVLIWPHR